jgi:hypothetical protein
MYSYPRGKFVGTINAAGGGGLCADRLGNVYIPGYIAGSGPVVYEFAHGGKHPIATLVVPGYFAGSCSANPMTGNLAVNFLCRSSGSSCGGENGLAVYANASGTPTIYQAATGEVFDYCGYDSGGNLFVDGEGGRHDLDFSELPEGNSSLIDISIDQSIGNPGQVQWDGSYITIQDEAVPGSIYRLEVSGSVATVVGVTELEGITGFSGQSWIQASTIIVGSKPRGQNSNIRFWRYPGGGKAYKRIEGFRRGAIIGAVTVSLAKH